MDTARFDQVTKILAAAGTRRWVIGGLLGGVLGLSRFRVTGASHRLGHHCTPSDEHGCGPGHTCRKVSGAWTCEVICQALQEECATDNDCCEGLRCCPSDRCESALDNCDGLD